MGAARRRRPVGPSAMKELNVVEFFHTKKINIIFFGLAAGAAGKDKNHYYGTPEMVELNLKKFAE